MLTKSFKQDKLEVQIYDTRAAMGAAAAADIEKAVTEVLAKQSFCNMIFAAAPSQNEVLSALAASTVIDWTRVNAYHMDEYIGISKDAPQGFANFLRAALFDKVPFASVNCLDCTADPAGEAERYGKLLKANPTDIVVMGIGENGHIAFNDPHVAKFDDDVLVKPVTLDETCRMQQVHDGCFATLDNVPKVALTLTIPALISAPKAFCIVPAKAKAKAVHSTVYGEITEACPASVLRRHQNAVLYLDADSASEL